MNLAFISSERSASLVLKIRSQPTPALQTAIGDTGTSFQPKFMKDAPLFVSGGFRNPERFIAYMPGVNNGPQDSSINGGSRRAARKWKRGKGFRLRPAPGTTRGGHSFHRIHRQFHDRDRGSWTICLVSLGRRRRLLMLPALQSGDNPVDNRKSVKFSPLGGPQLHLCTGVRGIARGSPPSYSKIDRRGPLETRPRACPISPLAEPQGPSGAHFHVDHRREF